ncbi:hypothetical protein J5N97_030221 [Dioscorea zingiberensis]|uniref:CCHC-type domain-containing protein n=1 Tax=Dioscorea zingiberensis TaxID=325984 RepID=A0A9D5BX97_9LILI|nr:hypothetical protein J5N97_030221 [Dioscorea zingiberensis]
MRRSPPTIQTPEGPIHVCGRCLKPGHRVDGCRRAVVCRRCGGTGHLAHHCKNPRVTERHLLTMEPHRRYEEPERHAGTIDKGKQRLRTEDANIHLKTTEMMISTTETEPPGKREVSYSIHHISVPLTSEMKRGKEKLRSHSIATVTAVREGMVNAAAVTGALTEALKGCTSKAEWIWKAMPFLDGRYMVACPSVEAAGELERGGAIHRTMLAGYVADRESRRGAAVGHHPTPTCVLLGP